MQVPLEFLYHVEIKTPKALNPVRHMLYGLAKVDIEVARPADLPVAFRLRDRNGNEKTFRTDGVETLGRFFEIDFEVLRGWFRGYTNRRATFMAHGEAAALRRWFGDGKPLHQSWLVTPERDYRRPRAETGLLVSDDRAQALATAHAKAARFVKVGREVWMRRGFGVLTVLPPGSLRDDGGRSGPKLVRTPRLELVFWRGRDDASAWRIAEYAARDLLFYPDEEIQARARAAEFGGRIPADWTVEASDLSCYPDLSALSMTSWTELLSRRAGPDHQTPVGVVPHERPAERPAPLPSEVEQAIEAFGAEAARGASGLELRPAFSSIAAAFGASLAASASARRPDIAQLLEMHARILRRVEMRPDRNAAAALHAADEAAVAALAEDETPSFRM